VTFCYTTPLRCDAEEVIEILLVDTSHDELYTSRRSHTVVK